VVTWPHDFTEDVNDYSMCLCGIPSTYHDAAMAACDGEA
jgi:hypothetical protein